MQQTFESFRKIEGKHFKELADFYEKESKKEMPPLKELLSEEMYSKFFEFQKKGIEFGLSRFGRVLIGDEMGLGKTV